VPLTLPPGTTLTPSHDDGTGTTTIFWGTTADFQVLACPGAASASWEITQGGVVIASGTLKEAPPGTYRATIPALAPNHGSAKLHWKVDCPGSPDVDTTADIFIDPSGFVRTVAGDPINGAKVTLSRSDTATGTFTVVPNLDATIMGPHNRR